MDIEFLEERIKDCYDAIRNLESLDFFNYTNARMRKINQKSVNKAFDVIFKLKKQLEYEKIRTERGLISMDLDEEELEETRRINTVISKKYVDENYIKKEIIQEELNKLYEKKLSDGSSEDIAILNKIEVLEELLNK